MDRWGSWGVLALSKSGGYPKTLPLMEKWSSTIRFWGTCWGTCSLYTCATEVHDYHQIWNGNRGSWSQSLLPSAWATWIWGLLVGKNMSLRKSVPLTLEIIPEVEHRGWRRPHYGAVCSRDWVLGWWCVCFGSSRRLSTLVILLYAGIWQNPAGMYRIPAAKSKRKITFQPVYDPVVNSSTNLYDRMIGKLRLSTRIVATNYGEPSCCNIQYMDVHGWSGKWPKWSSINPASTICIGSSIANKHLNKEPRATLFGQHVEKLQWKKQTWVLSVYAYCIHSTSILHLYSIYTRYILIPYNIYIYMYQSIYIYIWYDINPNPQHFHGRSCPTLHLVLDCVIIQELHQVYVALSLAPGERRKVVGGISICCCLWYIWCYIYI